MNRVIKNEHDIYYLLLFEQVDEVDRENVLNFEHNETYSQDGAKSAYIAAEEFGQYGCKSNRTS